MSIFIAILLGLVYGITEFLPISGSGHLSVLMNVFNMEYIESEHLLFDVMLKTGALVSVIMVYKKDLDAMLKDTLSVLMGREEESESGRLAPSVRNVFFVLVGTVPLVLVVPFYGKLSALFTNLPFVSLAFIVSGGLLYAAGHLDDGRKNEKTSTMLDVFIIGLAQAIAVIPGVSRVGAAISVGMARGFKKDHAVKFSFLLAIPALAGSILISFVSAIKTGVIWSSIPAYIVGMIVAAIVGYYAIFVVKKFLKNENFGRFAIYCWGIGIVSLIASIFVH